MSIRSFFGIRKANKSQSQYKRTLRMEALEDRTLLNAAPLTTDEYAAIYAQYKDDFDLPANMNDPNLNIITLDLAGGDGLTELKAAITTAGTTDKSDLIVVRTSDTVGDDDSANTIRFTSAADELTIKIQYTKYGSVTIVGLGTKPLTLDANQQSRIFNINASSSNTRCVVNLGGLTMTQGNGRSQSQYDRLNGYGGAVYVSYSTVTVSNCTITKNTAGVSGGGIYIPIGQLIVSNSYITNNTSNNSGGGIHSGYWLDVINSKILNNTTGGSGGGIANLSGTIYITDSEISGNTGNNGAGINSWCEVYNAHPTDPQSKITITNSTISDNKDGSGINISLETETKITNSKILNNDDAGIINAANSKCGGLTITNSRINNNKEGGIYNTGTCTVENSKILDNENGNGIYNSGTITVTDSTISGNSTTNNGGGISNEGTFTLTNSVISRNTSGYNGGGIYNWGGVFTVVNCEISRNTADNDGGGILNNSSTLTVTNTTISGNTAKNGGGIAHYIGIAGKEDTINIYNSIIACNTANEWNDITDSTTGTINGYNCLSSNTEWNDSRDNIEYDSSIPLFVNAENDNYHILPTSRAYNNGNNDNAEAAGLTNDSFDLAGFPRISSGIIDIGAYEYFVDATPIELNKTITGSLNAQNKYQDFYSFTVDSSQVISLSLLQGKWENLEIMLFGSGYSGEVTAESGKITLSAGGTYVLKVSSNTNQKYAFRVNLLEATDLKEFQDYKYQGTISGSRYAKLFKFEADETKILEFLLDADSDVARNEIYVKYNSTPSRSDYDWASLTDAPDQRLIIDNATPGVYYVLIYSDYCPASSNYTLQANLTSVLLEDFAQTGVGTDTLEFSISGAGFDNTVGVYVVNTQTGAEVQAQSVRLCANGQIAATFDKDLPNGEYKLRLKKGDDTADSLKTFTYSGTFVSGLKVDFDTKLILPGTLYAVSFRESCNIFYVEYTNNSEFAIAAPLLHLVCKNKNGEEKGLMTLDASLVGVSIPKDQTTIPDGFSTDLYMIASGETIGVLQPGETARIPVYWRGWMGSMQQVYFSLEVVAQDHTSKVNWERQLFGILDESEHTQNAAYLECIQNNLGDTWGDYVVNLSKAATEIYQNYGVKVRNAETLKAYLIDKSYHDSIVKAQPAQAVSGDSAETPAVTTAQLSADEEERQQGALYLYQDGGVWLPEGDNTFTSLPNVETYVIIHGMNNSINEPWIGTMADKLKKARPNANVLAVDWGEWAQGGGLFNINPATPAGYVSQVADHLAFQLFGLYGLDGSNTYLIGHSHGAHIAGLTGEFARLNYDTTVNKITALDPSEEASHVRGYNFAGTGWGPQSAQFVDVYKSSDVYGGETAWGHDNFLVVPENTIWDQFKFNVIGAAEANHSYAYQWFTTTITSSADTTAPGFWWNSSSWEKFLGEVNISQGNNNDWNGVIVGRNKIEALSVAINNGDYNLSNDPSSDQHWNYPGNWASYEDYVFHQDNNIIKSLENTYELQFAYQNSITVTAGDSAGINITVTDHSEITSTENHANNQISVDAVKKFEGTLYYENNGTKIEFGRKLDIKGAYNERISGSFMLDLMNSDSVFYVTSGEEITRYFDVPTASELYATFENNGREVNGQEISYHLKMKIKPSTPDCITELYSANDEDEIDVIIKVRDANTPTGYLYCNIEDVDIPKSEIKKGETASCTITAKAGKEFVDETGAVINVGVAGYEWTKITRTKDETTGEDRVSEEKLSGGNLSTLSVNDLTIGEYEFILTVWDNNNNRASASTSFCITEDPFEVGDHGVADEGKSVDPNEILCLSGKSDKKSPPTSWVSGADTLTYQVNFENDETANAPAQRVDVEMILDEDLDWRSFQFTGFGWADVYENLEDGVYTFNKVIQTEVTPLNQTEPVVIYVDVAAGIDLEYGRVYATFQTLQYTTLGGELEEAILLAPTDINVGFLLPSVKQDGENVDSRGEGFFTYTVKAKDSSVTNTEITAVADIQFDYGDVIPTNQTPHSDPPVIDPAREVPLIIDADKPGKVTITSLATSQDDNSINSITLQWIGSGDVGSGIDQYQVYVSLNNGNYSLWQTFDGSVTSATLNNAKNDTLYSFYVTAIDFAGNRSEDSNTLSVQTSGDPSVPVTQLATPTLGVELSGTNSVAVTVGSVENASGYTLQYATNEAFTENLATTPVVAGSNSINGLEPDTTYYFRVMATATGNYSNSNYSASQSVTIPPVEVIQLAAPTLGVNVTGPNSATVTVGNVDNASGYTLQYATNEDFTDNLATLAVVAGDNSIDDLEPGTEYFFRVMATGEGNYSDSDYSAPQSVTTPVVEFKLTTPTLGVELTGTNSVAVTIGSVDNASGYKLQYATNEDFTENLTTPDVVAGDNSIEDLEPGTTYYFRVKALGEGDYSNSDYSASQSVTTPPAEETQLAAPTLDVNVTGTNSATVTVGRVDNASGYTLQYATNEDFTDNLTTTAVVVGANSINGLEAGTEYYFRVMATGEGDYTDSEFSASVSAKTDEDAVNVKLAAPALGVNVTGSSTVSVTVGSVANASGYMLQYADNPNFTNSKSRRVTPGATSIGSLKVGTTYYFRVMAIGTDNYTNSDFSATQTATPSVKLAAPTLSVGESGSKSVSVTVGNVVNASGYTIQYSTDPGFANATTRSIKAGTTTIGGLAHDTTYYFRVMATGDGKYSNSDYSQTQEFTITNEYSDVSNLRAFLEQTDSNGVSNGQKMSDNYDPNDTSTWKDIIWKEVDGVERVTNIYWYDMGMVGALDLSDCTELTYLYCYSNELTDLDISGCTALKKVYCDRNQLTSLDVTNNTELTLLACYSNQLSELDLSQNTELTYLACYSNPIKTLDISNNPQLTTAYCWNPELERIIIDPEAEGLSVFLDYSDSTWTYQDANGETLSTGVTRFIYNASDSVALPVYATNESGSQIIAISASAVDPGQSVLLAPTLTVAATGIDSISVTVGEVENATGYTLQYSVNPNFTDAVTENVSAGVTDVNGLDVNTTYYFRALAIGSDDYASSNYCSVQSVTTDCIQLAEPELLSVVPNGYGSVSVTVGEVENASGYALEYSTSEDFSDANVMNVSAGSTTVKDLNVGSTYYFRVQALGTGDYSDSDFSAALSAKIDDLKVSINGKKVVVEWYDESPAADSIRYRVAGTTRWTTAKLKAGVTTYSFNGTLGSDYEIEVLLDQQEDNVLQGAAVVLDQPKLTSVKNELKEDSFQVNVTNYAAKNLAANVNQATVTVNGVPTTFDIAEQQGECELPDGGKVSFNNGLFTFTEMASNTSYKVQVVFSDGNSDSTASSALTVKTAKTFYLAPTITSAVAVSDSCIDVTWETSYGAKSNIEAQKYTVQYSTDGVKWTTATTAATGNAYTIQKLKGGVEYQVRVLATKDNAFDASAPSDALTAETIALPKIALEKNSVQDDSFQLNVTNYQNTNLANVSTINVKSDKFGTTVVFLLDGQGSATFSNGMTVNFNNGAMTFANVPSNTQQKIQISFREGPCTTAWSSALTVKTLMAPYNKPVLTNATAVSSTSIEVNWETAYGKNSTVAAQKYTVQYSTDGVKWTNATTSATGTSFTITKLKANTKYLVAVIANKDSNFIASQPSDSLLVTTLI